MRSNIEWPKAAVARPRQQQLEHKCRIKEQVIRARRNSNVPLFFDLFAGITTNLLLAGTHNRGLWRLDIGR